MIRILNPYQSTRSDLMTRAGSYSWTRSMRDVGIALCIVMAMITPCVHAADATDLVLDGDKLTQSCADPGDTGLLINRVLAGSAALRAGVLPGDILLTYNGTRIMHGADLSKAVDQLTSSAPVLITINRKWKVQTLTIDPGLMGVAYWQVYKGYPIDPPVERPLPDESAGAVFDFSRIPTKGVDSWYEVTVEDQHLGGIHVAIRHRRHCIQWTIEVSYMAGHGFSQAHYLVRSITTDDPRPCLIKSDGFNLLSGADIVLEVHHHQLNKKCDVTIKDSIHPDLGAPFIQVDPTAILVNEVANLALAPYVPLTDNACIHVTFINLQMNAVNTAAFQVGELSDADPSTHTPATRTVDIVYDYFSHQSAVIDLTGHLLQGVLVQNRNKLNCDFALSSEDDATHGLKDKLVFQTASDNDPLPDDKLVR